MADTWELLTTIVFDLLLGILRLSVVDTLPTQLPTQVPYALLQYCRMSLMLISNVYILNLNYSQIKVHSPDGPILLNSTEYYYNQTATWAFVFNLDIPPINPSTVLSSSNAYKVPIIRILRVKLKLDETESSQVDGFSLFASRSNERFQYIKLFTPNNSRITEVNNAIFLARLPIIH